MSSIVWFSLVEDITYNIWFLEIWWIGQVVFLMYVIMYTKIERINICLCGLINGLLEVVGGLVTAEAKLF